MSKTVLILGGRGKIGAHCTRVFSAAGWQVRQFDRSKDTMIDAARGADVIVNGLNPPYYHNWATLIPQITQQVIEAAKESGATVILPGNIYNFGVVNGVIDENTPHRPNSRKGQIRVDMEAAYRASGVQTIILRAGNFIDPEQNGDVMSLFIMRSAKSRRITIGGDPDARQAFAYVPDWARAALGLAEMRDTLQTFEDIPFAGHTLTLNDIQQHAETLTGQKFKLSRFPWWVMSALGPFWELARELKEMRYMHDMSHEISGDKLARLLPDFRATDPATVIAAGLPRDVYPDQAMRAGSAHGLV